MIRVAHSNAPPKDVAKEIKTALSGIDARVILWFSSMKHDPEFLASQMGRAFPGVILAGCTTAGELVSGSMLKGSVVAMALDAEEVDLAGVEVVDQLSRGIDLTSAFERLEARFESPLEDLDVERHVGIVLIDGMSGREEALLEALGDRTDLMFLGGSAGDEMQFRRTWVFAGGRSYTDAAVLLLLRPRKGFDILKTQSFVPTGTRLIATEVDEAQRLVHSFNGLPAAEAYANALGTTPALLDREFMRHPLGLMVGNEPWVRSPQRVIGTAVKFYCNIRKGMELQILTSGDIVEETRRALDAKIKEHGRLSGVVNFNCILRTLELEAKDQTGAYGSLFARLPTVGFSTYGESFLGHINQTATMLLLK